MRRREIAGGALRVAVVRVPGGEAEDVRLALAMLTEARDLLARGGAHRTAARVRLAISSCKGAVRNAEAKPYRAERRRPAYNAETVRRCSNTAGPCFCGQHDDYSTARGGA